MKSLVCLYFFKLINKLINKQSGSFLLTYKRYNKHNSHFNKIQKSAHYEEPNRTIMNRDLPSILFPDLSEYDKNEIRTPISDLNDFLNLRFNQPVNAFYNDDSQQVTCLSNKYQLKYCINRMTSFMPWSMPEKCDLIGNFDNVKAKLLSLDNAELFIFQQGIDPYLDIKSNQNIKFTNVICKNTRGYFYMHRFANGS